MIKTYDNGKTNFYFDEYGMMLDRSDWNKHGQGDALWRTGLAAIASGGDFEILDSIMGCLKFINNKVRFIRHPKDMDDDTSRDQVIMALIAIKKHIPYTFSIIQSKLDFRISKKFTWQDAWFWAKGNYRIWRITSCYHFIGWFFEPSYSLHLFCWMLWSSGEKAKFMKWFLLKFIVPKENYLLRALLGVKEDIPELKPMADFRWQRDFPWKEGEYLTEEEAEYNTLDIDVLKAIKEL